MPSTLPPIFFDIATAGVRSDLSQRLVPPGALWAAENVAFARGAFRVRDGLAPLATPLPARIMGLVSFNDEVEARKIYIGTTEGACRWDESGGTWSLIDDTWTGDETCHVQFRTFVRSGIVYLILCNGKDHPKYIKASGLDEWFDLGTTGDEPPDTTCALAVSRNRLVALSRPSGGTLYISDRLDFNTGWGDTTTGFPVSLGETPGDGVGLMEMGNLQFAAFKTDAIYVAVAQGGTYPFSISRANDGQIVGPCSPAAIVPLPDGSIAYLGRDGAPYLWSGHNPDLCSVPAQRYIASVADVDNLNRASGFYDPLSAAIWWFFPRVGSQGDPSGAVCLGFPGFEMWPNRWESIRPTCGLVVQTELSDTWQDAAGGTWAEDVGSTWTDCTQLRQVPLVGSASGQLYVRRGSADETAPIPAYWVTGLTDGGDRTKVKTAVEAEHLFSGRGQHVTVKLGVSDFGERVTFGAGQDLEVTPDEEMVSGHRDDGRGFALRFESSSTDPLKWEGSALHVRPKGTR